MSQLTVSQRESQLRALDRWVMLAIALTCLLPLVPYALQGVAS
jgi:hypothetical protein